MLVAIIRHGLVKFYYAHSVFIITCVINDYDIALISSLNKGESWLPDIIGDDIAGKADMNSVLCEDTVCFRVWVNKILSQPLTHLENIILH